MSKSKQSWLDQLVENYKIPGEKKSKGVKLLTDKQKQILNRQ